jgi:hypothetical protein
MISSNGWPVYTDTSHFTRFTAGGRRWWAANADCAVVAAEFINRWNAEVESVTKDDPELDDWSYALRPVRGQTTGYSNHASATAWDINALQHPRGVAVAKTFTRAQVATIHRIRAAITDDAGHPVLRWGGDYVNAPIDGMHVEINATAARVKQAADKIRNRQKEENDMPLSDTDKAWLKKAIHDEVVAVLTTEKTVDNRDENNQPIPGSRVTVTQALAGLDQKVDFYLAPRLNTIIANTTPVEPPPPPA